MKPKANVNINQMQKWLGSIPISTATGSKRGPRIRIFGTKSMNMPKIRTIMKIIAIKNIGLSVIDKSAVRINFCVSKYVMV